MYIAFQVHGLAYDPVIRQRCANDLHTMACKSPDNLIVIQRLAWANSKETSKHSLTGISVRESTSDQWIPFTMGQQCGKCFRAPKS